jgi:hypothetical protein
MAIEDELAAAFDNFSKGNRDAASWNRMAGAISSAITEIKHLRSLAGAVTQGDMFDDIRKRQGTQQVTE